MKPILLFHSLAIEFNKVEKYALLMIFFPSQWRVYLMVICNLCKNMTVKEMVVWPTFFQLWSRIWMMMMEDHPYRSPRCSPTLDCSGVKRFASAAQCSELLLGTFHLEVIRAEWETSGLFFQSPWYLLSVSKKNTVIDRISISLVQKPFWSQSKDSDTSIFLLPFKRLIKAAKNWKMLLI